MPALLSHSKCLSHKDTTSLTVIKQHLGNIVSIGCYGYIQCVEGKFEGSEISTAIVDFCNILHNAGVNLHQLYLHLAL